jgi:serine/threonine protein kinase
MGEVFLAHHERIKCRVAVKILHTECAGKPEVASRFEREALAANLVNHPDIATVFEIGEHPTAPTKYIVMQYLEGVALDVWAASSAQEERVRIFRHIALVLAAAHEFHVVHRDVKPSNILIASDHLMPGRHRAKLLDFGIAMIRDVALEVDEGAGAPGPAERTTSVVGTYAYMAPEQAFRPNMVSGKADVYALGTTFYEILTGALPSPSRPT